MVSGGGTRLATGMSPDGQLLMYTERPTAETPTPRRFPAIWVAPLATVRADTKAEPFPFLPATAGTEGVFRPGGHWVASVTGEGGLFSPKSMSFPSPGPAGENRFHQTEAEADGRDGGAMGRNCSTRPERVTLWRPK
jgi:hypothetical protein